MGVYVVLFVAGILTILLPCILPLVPIVLGVSVTGRRRWRPLQIVAGMVVGFVLVTGILQVVLAQFVRVADRVRIASFYLLLLLGFGCATEKRWVTNLSIHESMAAQVPAVKQSLWLASAISKKRPRAVA